MSHLRLSTAQCCAHHVQELPDVQPAHACSGGRLACLVKSLVKYTGGSCARHIQVVPPTPAFERAAVNPAAGLAGCALSE